MKFKSWQKFDTRLVNFYLQKVDTDVYYDKICFQEFGYNSSVCDNIDKFPDVEEDIQIRLE